MPSAGSSSSLVKRAGLTLWPRVFQNLRSTRSTELADEFPGHVVSAWLGHSEDIAKEHYRQVTEEHFLRATSKAVPDLMPHDAVLPCIDSQTQNQVHAQLVSAQRETAARGNMRPFNLEDRGLERVSVSGIGGMEIERLARQNCSTDATFADLARLIAAWPLITREARHQILNVVRESPLPTTDSSDFKIADKRDGT